MFRTDHITALAPCDERFENSPERSLSAFLARGAEEKGCELPPDPLGRAFSVRPHS